MKLEIPKQEHTEIIPFVTGHVWITQKINTEQAHIVIPVENVDLFCHMLQEAKRQSEERRDRAMEIRAEFARKGLQA